MTTRPDTTSAPTKSTGSRRFYNPSLDGLRFFAFVGVFVLHSFGRILPPTAFAPAVQSWVKAALDAGAYGVDLFFVLSSYLITKLLLLERESSGSIDIRSFYVRRILRIWPLYFAFLVYMFALQLAGGSHPTPIEWLGFLFFFVNWVGFFQGDFVGGHGSMLWTVSIEEQFYISWPWIVAKLTPRQLVRVCWAFVGLSVMVGLALDLAHAPPTSIGLCTFSRLGPLALGAILAASPAIEGWFAALRRPLIYPPLCIVALIVLVRANVMPGVPLAARAVTMQLPAAALCALAVGCMLGPNCSRLKVFSWPPIVYLGRISYGLYIYHGTMVGLGTRVFQRIHVPGGAWVIIPLEFVGTIVVASISFKYLERPFLSWKQRFAKVQSRPGG